jgi:hypothetical protein
VTEQGAPRKTPPPGSPNPDRDKMSDEEYYRSQYEEKKDKPAGQ